LSALVWFSFLSLDFGGYLEAGRIPILVAQSPVDLQTDGGIDGQDLEAVLVGVHLAGLQGAAHLLLAGLVVDVRTGAGAVVSWEGQGHVQDDALDVGGQLLEVTLRPDLHLDAGLRVALQDALALRAVRDGHLSGSQRLGFG